MAVALAAIASLAGFAGGLWWAVDLFAHFRPQYLIAGVLLAAFLAVAGRVRWAVAALVIAALNAIPVVSLYLETSDAARPATGQALRLMAFIVFAHNRDYAETLHYVQRELPDVLVMLEVTPGWVPTVRTLAATEPRTTPLGSIR